MGLQGRVTWLAITLAGQGLFLVLFSQMNVLILAIATMILFSLFVQMAEGATFSVVPFVNRRAVGAVSGVVGAGGNAGAVAAGFLFRGGYSYQEALLMIGIAVVASAAVALLVRFTVEENTAVEEELNLLLRNESV